MVVSLGCHCPGLSSDGSLSHLLGAEIKIAGLVSDGCSSNVRLDHVFASRNFVDFLKRCHPEDRCHDACVTDTLIVISLQKSDTSKVHVKETILRIFLSITFLNARLFLSSCQENMAQ